jgi:hypothetical protein
MDEPEYAMVISQVLRTRVDEIAAETERAMSLHPSISTAHEGYAVIKEEFEEFWEEVKLNPSKLSAMERADRLDRMRKELIHTAAMCVRTMLDLAL